MSQRVSMFALCALLSVGCEVGGEEPETPTDEAGNDIPFLGADTSGRYVGCFTDEPNRALERYFGELDYMTPLVCSQICEDYSYPYAGVQYGRQCFCGTRPGYAQVPDDQCDVPCAGDGNLSCGGSWHNSIYTVPPRVVSTVQLFDLPGLAGDSATVTIGSSWVGDAWNDRISSMRVSRGWKVTVYEHRDFEGARLELIPSRDTEYTDYDLPVYGFWDNRISSFTLDINR